ncbi:MAG: winged helix-turn-helix domain-containing protein [Chloroflexota bacterium]
MLENPFFHRGPIRDPEYFYNRERETKLALQMLAKKQSVSVIGPRKIGKTSLLFHISRPEVMRQHGIDPTQHLFVYINCEELGHLSREALYTLLVGEISDQARRQGHHIALPDRPDSHLEFERAMGEVFRQGLRLALLFDEFEILSENQSLGSAFFSGLRALPNRFDMAYLTASRRPLLSLPHTEEYSPFFNIFVPLKLGLFSETASRQLIENSLTKAGVTLSPSIVDGVLTLGGGHPFFLQVAAFWALELQETKGSPLQIQDMRLLNQSVRGQIESHFDYYWNHLRETECYVLAALPLTQEEGRYREEIEALASLCLIVPENGRYRYFSPLFGDFVRRQQIKGLLQAGPFLLDLANRRALQRGEPLSLSVSQYELMVYLMEHRDRVIGNEELDREVLGASEKSQGRYEYLGDERLKSAIKGLRKALGKDAICIENKRGIGYVFRVRPSEHEDV